MLHSVLCIRTAHASRSSHPDIDAENLDAMQLLPSDHPYRHDHHLCGSSVNLVRSQQQERLHCLHVCSHHHIYPPLHKYPALQKLGCGINPLLISNLQSSQAPTRCNSFKGMTFLDIHAWVYENINAWMFSSDTIVPASGAGE